MSYEMRHSLGSTSLLQQLLPRCRLMQCTYESRGPSPHAYDHKPDRQGHLARPSPTSIRRPRDQHLWTPLIQEPPPHVLLTQLLASIPHAVCTCAQGSDIQRRVTPPIRTADLWAHRRTRFKSRRHHRKQIHVINTLRLVGAILLFSEVIILDQAEATLWMADVPL